MAQEWVPAVTAIGGVVLGVTGIGFGYLTARQERADRTRAADREWHRSQLATLDSRAYEKRSDTYADMLLTVGVLTLVVERWLPAFDEIVDVNGLPVASASDILGGPVTHTLIDTKAVARLASDVSAFGSEPVSELVEEFLTQLVHAMSIGASTALACDLPLLTTELARYVTPAEDDLVGEQSGFDLVEPHQSEVAAAPTPRDLVEIAMLVDEIVYLGTLFTEELDVSEPISEQDGGRFTAIAAWLDETADVRTLWDDLRSANAGGDALASFRDVLTEVQNELEVVGASFEAVLHGLRSRTSRGVFLLQSGGWFSSNAEEWAVAMSAGVRRSSLELILPSEVVNDLERASAAKARLRSTVRKIQQQVRSELLPPATAHFT